MARGTYDIDNSPLLALYYGVVRLIDELGRRSDIRNCLAVDVLVSSCEW